MAYVLHQLAHGSSNFLSANANDHAFGGTVVLLRHLLVRCGLLLALTAPA